MYPLNPRIRVFGLTRHRDITQTEFIRALLIVISQDRHHIGTPAADEFVIGVDHLAAFVQVGGADFSGMEIVEAFHRDVIRLVSVENGLDLIAQPATVQWRDTEFDHQRKRRILGGLLTELLATHTLVFVGYSLSDWNFRRLYKALLKDMGQYAEAAYFGFSFRFE